MIENVSTQLTVFHCLCPLPASRKGLRLPLRSALFGEGGSDWRPCYISLYIKYVAMLSVSLRKPCQLCHRGSNKPFHGGRLLPKIRNKTLLKIFSETMMLTIQVSGIGLLSLLLLSLFMQTNGKFSNIPPASA